MTVMQKFGWIFLVVAVGCSKTPIVVPASDGAVRSAAESSETESTSAATPAAEPRRSSDSHLDILTAAIPPEAAQRAGIEVAQAGPAQIREGLMAYGSIRSNAEREQEVRARYPGVVRSVAKRAGDGVAKGEALLTVESNESLQVYAIHSPLTGQVLERKANPGDAVDGTTMLMRVADLSSVWAEFAIFPRDLGRVRPGMRVVIRGSDTEQSDEAKIIYVAPAGYGDSQSVVARATVNNPRGRWVPGQFVTGDIETTAAEVPVAVKPTALQEFQGRTNVFVQNAKGFAARPVEVGRRSREAVEITRGLVAGERYAAQNSYLIKADLLKAEAEED